MIVSVMETGGTLSSQLFFMKSKKMKKCSNAQCKKRDILQPFENFDKNKSAKDGYNNWCKDCMKEYRLKNFKKLSIKSKANKSKKALFISYTDKLLKINELHRRDPNNSKFIQIKDLSGNWFTPTVQQIQDRIKKFNAYYKRYTKFSEKIVLDLLYFEEEARQGPNNSDLLQVKCRKCGKWFNPTNVTIQSRLSVFRNNRSGNGFFYCSEECKSTCILYNRTIDPFEKRELSENRKKEIQLRQDILMSELRNMVFKRDNYTCQRCNKSKNEENDIKLFCHHLIPVKYDILIASDIDNCITLCEDCHILIHKNHNCKSIIINKTCS